MATVDKYTIKMNVDGKDKVVDMTNAVGGLGKVISNVAKIGIGSLTALGVAAARTADKMVDLAGTAGMSAGKIYQMSVAAQAAGGDFDQVSGMLLKFSSSVQSAVDGSAKMIDSFAKIGVSRQDLEYLSDEQLFQAVVSGLGNMADGAEKTALAVELLGKKAATTNLKQFAQDISQAVDPSVERNLLNAAKAVTNVEKAFRDLQMAALQVFAPIIEVIGNFEVSVDDAAQALRVFSAVLAAAFAASTVIAIARVVAVLKAKTVALTAATVAAATLQALTGPKGWAIIAAAAGAGTATYLALGKAIDEATEAQENFNDAASNFVGPVRPDPTQPVRTLNLDANERAVILAKQTTEQMKLQNDLAIGLRTTILSVSNLERNRAQQLIADNQALNEFKLAEQRIKDEIALEEAKGVETNQQVIEQLQERLKLNRFLLDETYKLNRLEYNRLETQRLLAGVLSNQQAQFDLQRLSNEANRNARVIELQLQGKSLEMAQKEIDAKIRETDFIIKNRDLNNQIRIARIQGFETEAVALEDLKRQELNRYVQVDAAIKREQNAIDDLNNSRIAGVVSAMEQLQQQFTPYQMAQDAVLSTWNNIGSAIDRIAQGGKASFKDMARSIIADLGAMIAKAYLFEAIKGSMSMFGFKLPGLATGGPAKAGQPYIVGEKGPELFVPKQAGTVIPNNKLNATQTQQPQQAAATTTVNNVYNISAVDAKSVAQLFYENRKTMLGTMAIAQKELPYGMAG